MDYRSLLSKHRAAIMGAMAVLILFFHANLPVPFRLYNTLINTYGNTGVDVFVFLSGFGLTYALEKSSGFGEYMGHRIRRILPSYYAYLLFRIFFSMLKSRLLPSDLFIQLFPVGEWINTPIFDWYVSAILGFYVIAALLYPMMRRSKYLVLTAALLLVLTGWYVPSISQMNNSVHTIPRIPDLMIGLAVGCAARREEPRYRKGWLGLAGFALLALCGVAMNVFSAPLKSTLFRLFNPEVYRRMQKMLLTPLFTVLLACGFEICSRLGLGIINRAFGWLGKYTLEFYLCHIPLLSWASSSFSSPYIRVFIALLLSCPFSVAVQWTGKQLYKLWMRLVRRLSLEN